MHPNGRTIYKLIMKKRKTVFWGSRSFIKVRLPISVVPVSPPSCDYCKNWGESTTSGVWNKRINDNTIECRRIHVVTSCSDPTDSRNSKSSGLTIHHLSSRSHKSGRFTQYSWLEAYSYFLTEDEPGNVENIPAEDVDAHYAFMFWENSYLHELDHVDRGPVLQAFLDVSKTCKTHYAFLSEDCKYVYFLYSVKWFYKNDVRLFSLSLRRAFRVSCEHGIDARLIR